jgi:hypothetical protein
MVALLVRAGGYVVPGPRGSGLGVERGSDDRLDVGGSTALASWLSIVAYPLIGSVWNTRLPLVSPRIWAAKSSRFRPESVIT